jgi:hypothetical protein
MQDSPQPVHSGSTECSLEARCLFPLTTESRVQENHIVVDEAKRNVLLDYSSITDAQPAEEVLCSMEVRRKEAEVRDTNSVAPHKDMKELKIGVEEAIQDQLIQIVKG